MDNLNNILVTLDIISMIPFLLVDKKREILTNFSRTILLIFLIYFLY